MSTSAFPTAAATAFKGFVDRTGSPYHSVFECQNILEKAGFQRLSERKTWHLEKGGKYYTVRGGSEIFSFVVGQQFDPTTSSMVIIGTHTDSPCLRLRPNAAKESEGMLELGVAPYGGGLWHTWFDRGLGLAGKIVYHSGGALHEKLVRVPRPVAILPNLCRHLQSNEERAAFKINPEEHLMPVFCSKKYATTEDKVRGNHRVFLELLADEAGCEVDDILDFDICMMDSTPASFVGLYEEFLASARIDNLVSTFSAFTAIATEADELAKGSQLSVAVAFNHEEVGSRSATGANSKSVQTWIERLLTSFSARNYYSQLVARSILVSADGEHAVHPNYPDRHQAEHKTGLGKGVAIKINPNQLYATNAATTAITEIVAEKSNVPLQEFTVKNGTSSGSTIGPMLSANLGIRTVDLGITQWAMHSIRETCSVEDIDSMLRLCEGFYKYFTDVEASFVEA
ncbi:hypothetical protein FOL47_010668 [Perkinsus chesapeaki]|uniref:aspartyl aminopeptidase n=1 Tax=Perkinsus chesapeaki TaxID=330153 RepID=A0A7J6L123_PERCH|nr:hypothetical protein FOL47_010668 [Perkinsus chesapeaki]